MSDTNTTRSQKERIPLGHINPVSKTAQKMRQKISSNQNAPSIPNKSKISDIDVIGQSTSTIQVNQNLLNKSTKQMSYAPSTSTKLSSRNSIKSQAFLKATQSFSQQKNLITSRFFDQITRVLKTKYYKNHFNSDSNLQSQPADVVFADLLQQFLVSKRLISTISNCVTFEDLQIFLDEIGFTSNKLFRNYFKANSQQQQPINQRQRADPVKVIPVPDLIKRFKEYFNIFISEKNALAEIQSNCEFWIKNKLELCYYTQQKTISEKFDLNNISSTLLNNLQQCMADRNECIGEKFLLSKFLFKSLKNTTTSYLTQYQEQMKLYIECKQNRISIFETFILSFLSFISQSQRSTVMSIEAIANFLGNQKYPKQQADELLIMLQRIQKYYQLQQNENEMLVSIADISNYCQLYKNRQQLKQQILHRFLEEMNQYISEHSKTSQEYNVLIFTLTAIRNIDNDIANLLSKTSQIVNYLGLSMSHYMDNEHDTSENKIRDILKEPISFSCSPQEYFEEILFKPKQVIVNIDTLEDQIETSGDHFSYKLTEEAQQEEESAVDRAMRMHQDQVLRINGMVQFWGGEPRDQLLEDGYLGQQLELKNQLSIVPPLQMARVRGISLRVEENNSDGKREGRKRSTSSKSGHSLGMVQSGSNQNVSTTSIRFDFGLPSVRTSRNVTVHGMQPVSLGASQRSIYGFGADKKDSQRNNTLKSSRSQQFLESARNQILERQQSSRLLQLQKAESVVKIGLSKQLIPIDNIQPANEEPEDSFIKQLEKQIEDMQNNLNGKQEQEEEEQDPEDMYYRITNKMYFNLCALINSIKEEFTIA